MESGQVKTGDNAQDIYIRMLQENLRITAPIAFGISTEYPTVQELVKGLRSDGPLALADCMTSSNKNGGFTNRRIGPAISKRVHSVFLGRDEWSYDV